MRRSLCPSIVKQKDKEGGCDRLALHDISNKQNSLSNNIKKNDTNDDLVISRRPLFGFLQVPESDLRKQVIINIIIITTIIIIIINTIIINSLLYLVDV